MRSSSTARTRDDERQRPGPALRQVDRLGAPAAPAGRAPPRRRCRGGAPGRLGADPPGPRPSLLRPVGGADAAERGPPDAATGPSVPPGVRDGAARIRPGGGGRAPPALAAAGLSVRTRCRRLEALLCRAAARPRGDPAPPARL